MENCSRRGRRHSLSGAFDGARRKSQRTAELGMSRDKTGLAYGSSITQGCGALCPQLNYLNTVAQILGIDIQNKAIAGGCFCERETVEYLCRETFDAVYLEPGTNIANRPLAIIEERVGTLIDTFCERFADKKIFIMTPVRGLSDVSKTTEDYTEYYARSRGVIVSHAQRYANAILLDGHKFIG